MTRLSFIALILPLQGLMYFIATTFEKDPQKFEMWGQGIVSGTVLYFSILGIYKFLEYFLYRFRLSDIGWSVNWALLIAIIAPLGLLILSYVGQGFQSLYNIYSLVNSVFTLILCFKR